MKKIIIIGGRGTVIVIADQIMDAVGRFGESYEILGLALDDLSGGNVVGGYPIVSPIKEVYARYGRNNDVFFIYSLYRPDVMRERTEILYSLQIPKEKFLNFVHPSVMVSRTVEMGYGNIVLANAVLNTGLRMGNFNTINSATLLGHDTLIGDNNFVAGHCTIGSGINIGSMNFFGLNSSLRNGLTVGDENIVAMGANVVKNIQSKEILVGNPAGNRAFLNSPIR